MSDMDEHFAWRIFGMMNDNERDDLLFYIIQDKSPDYLRRKLVASLTVDDIIELAELLEVERQELEKEPGE